MIIVCVLALTSIECPGSMGQAKVSTCRNSVLLAGEKRGFLEDGRLSRCLEWRQPALYPSSVERASSTKVASIFLRLHLIDGS